ncbi:hypothetical protein SEVIR_3G402250v4 [Setaria viridis]|uniref:Uncharacterized protein n=1 Tax=Setaria viridis TaxID=4556 RepID=A0A4U6VL50_SETVI|nr:hypothetical protein SEVIR_3G402250v2 [Setaria viridis]
MRVTVPVLPMMDQCQGGHSSEPSRPFFPSSSPYPDLHTRRWATRSLVNSSCFSPMQPAASGRGLTCPRPPKSLWSLEEAWPWLRSLAGLVAVIICCTCRGIWHWRDENFFEN